MKTIRIFYEDVYQKEFHAKVLSCFEQEGIFWVELDQTAFYPEGGGQPAEGGMLEEAIVEDVQYDGNRILHKVSRAFTEGEEVTGVINWQRRFQLMQQHSGEHIVSGLIHKHFGYDNVGFHMGSDFITIDVNGMITQEQLAMIEAESNQYIWENHPISIFYPDEKEREALPYRSKKELTGEVRLVEFPGADLCACCGLHVKDTGEIGLVKLISVKKFREGVRIEMLCGKDAFEYLNIHYEQNSQIAVELSVKPEETMGAVLRQSKENFSLKGEIAQMKQSTFDRMAALCKDKGNVVIMEEGLTAADIRKCADAILSECAGICAVFSGDDQNGYKYAVGEKDGNVKELVSELNKELSGRGGGKPFFAQGSLQGKKEEIIGFFQQKGFFLM